MFLLSSGCSSAQLNGILELDEHELLSSQPWLLITEFIKEFSPLLPNPALRGVPQHCPLKGGFPLLLDSTAFQNLVTQDEGPHPGGGPQHHGTPLGEPALPRLPVPEREKKRRIRV